MDKLAEVKEGAALEIRFGAVDLTQIRLRTTDPGSIVDELTGRVATAPRFFEQAAVGIDFGPLEREPELEEAREVVRAIKRSGVLVVGLVHGDGFVETLAHELALPLLPPVRARSKAGDAAQAIPIPEPQPATTPASAVTEAEPETDDELHALVYQQPIRSGQRVYARRRDLVVTTTVAAGAEVIADGCVHIYGALRGRAMAGVHGNADARMFCQEFYAELVSVAGVFRVFESLPEELAGHPVQAWLEGDDLRFARVGG